MREMKGSGIDVIGEIPSSWNLRRLKYLCSIQTGNEDTQNADPDGQYPFYVRSPIVEKCARYTFDGEGVLMAGDGAGAGRIFHHVYGKYAVHQRVYRLSNFKDINTEYFFYFLSSIFPKIMDKGSAQSTVPSVRLPMLLNCEICLPGSTEQCQIADFLDAKCAEIDSLSTDIQREIDTLEQFKQSTITEAVTMGLNPDVEMKYSGAGWMPTIPAHWKVDKLKYHLRYSGSRSPGESEVLSLYRELGVVLKNSRDDNHNVTSEDTANYKFVRIGDFVVNKMKAWQGSVAVSDYEGIVSPAYYVYRFTDNVFDRKYFHYLLRNKTYATEFMRLSGGIRVGQWDLPASALENTLVLIPPRDEQKAVADYLDVKCAEIDILIREKREQLSVIEDYKKSIIYEYITGKKEVPST